MAKILRYGDAVSNTGCANPWRLNHLKKDNEVVVYGIAYQGDPRLSIQVTLHQPTTLIASGWGIQKLLKKKT